MKMEIDTGATCSTMSQESVKKHFGNIEILPSEKKILSYDKSQIKVLGELHVDVEHNGQIEVFPSSGHRGRSHSDRPTMA